MQLETPLRKATTEDIGLITELVNLSNNTGAYGRGYPQGDFAGLEHEFEEIDKNLLDSFYIVGGSIGIIGIFNSPWGCYLIGPVFKPEHHTVENATAALEEVIALKKLRGKDILLDSVEENQIIMQAANQAGFSNTYRGVSMAYPITAGEIRPVHSEVAEINLSDKNFIAEIDKIFAADLKPWRRHDASDLVEHLADGNPICVALLNGQVVGALVWSWDQELEEGEIEYLCVANKYQGNGFAKDLMNFATNWVAAKLNQGETATWYLDTERTNTQAIGYYEHYGFKVHYYRSAFNIETTRSVTETT